MKKMIALLLAFALLFTFSACASDEQVSTTENQVDGSAESDAADSSEVESQEKILRLIKNTDLKSMDAQRVKNDVTLEVLTSCMDGLYYINQEGLPETALAESTYVSDDGKKYVFMIREAYWANGDPVTAHDFVYAWRRLADPEVASEYAYLLGVSGIKNGEAVVSGELPPEELGVYAEDDKMLIVELERRIPYFFTLTSFAPFFPLNEKFVEEKGDAYGSSVETMLSNGAFMLTDWNKGDSWKLVKNPDYYDADDVKLDAIEYQYMEDAEAAVLEYEAGNADFVSLPIELVEDYREHRDYHVNYGENLWYLNVNSNKPEFVNEDLAKALKYSVDQEKLANTLLIDQKDVAIPMYGLVPFNMALSPVGEDFRVKSVNQFEYDKELAVNHWDQAKERLQKENIEVNPLQLELLYDDSELSQYIAEFVKQGIESTLDGVSIQLKCLSEDEISELLQDKEKEQDQNQNEEQEKPYDIVLRRWSAKYPDPMSFLELYMENNPRNYSHWRNNDYQRMMKECLAARDDSEFRWHKLQKAERKFLINKPGGPIPLYQDINPCLFNPRVKGVIKSAFGTKFKYKYADIE